MVSESAKKKAMSSTHSPTRLEVVQTQERFIQSTIDDYAT